MSLEKDSNVNECALTMAINCTAETPNYHSDVQHCSGDQYGQWPLVSCDRDMCHNHTTEQQENWTIGLGDQTESHISLKNIHHLPQQFLIGLFDEQLQSLGEVNHLCPWSTPWDSQSHCSPQRTPTLLFCTLIFSEVAKVLVHSTVKKQPKLKLTPGNNFF